MYSYKVRKNNMVLGIKIVSNKLVGRYAVFPVINQKGRLESIEVPIKYLCLLDNGIFYTIERYLDVSKKSKRQIELLLHKGVVND